MRRVFLLLLLLACACITDAEVDGALDGYCAVNEGKQCSASSQCCPGFACVSAVCRQVQAGTCLFAADAGRVQRSGEPCGCSGDCVSGTCSESRCP